MTKREAVLSALSELNETVGRRQLDRIAALFERDAVLIGTARYNGTREEITA